MATEPTKLSGKVVNGVVVFENGDTLPDGTEVRVEPINDEIAKSHDSQNVWDMLLSLSGVIKDDDLPTDLSVNLDHYLYGTPKKEC
jgi:hypothetical protein